MDQTSNKYLDEEVSLTIQEPIVSKLFCVQMQTKMNTAKRGPHTNGVLIKTSFTLEQLPVDKMNLGPLCLN